VRGFTVADTAPLQLDRMGPLAEMYVLSPFVWREGGTYKMLLRAVPRSERAAEKIARVHYGESRDGLRFAMRVEPSIAPGPGEDDMDGCEDPTLAMADGQYYVYYTGWNESAKRGQLLLASGSDPERLTKRGVALPWTPERKNPKEATIVRARDGTWRLFFEYAADDKSKIGVASAPAVDGPWTVQHLLLEARADSWDSWHLSTGPIVFSDSAEPVMFYNGATRDAAWRIGWIAFDDRYSRVTARCEEPLIVPPARRDPDATDIAFAASAVEEDGELSIYYSIADKDMCRATVLPCPPE